MVKRLGIAIGALAAAAVLTVGLVAAGFGPAPRNGEAVEAASVASGAEQAGKPGREPEVVYVKPARKPRTIVVERTAARSSGSGSSSSQDRTVRVLRQQEADREDREDREDHEDREDREHESRERHDD
jgi:hypothetical protein